MVFSSHYLLVQQLWELKIDWDDPVPLSMKHGCNGELNSSYVLYNWLIHRCHFPKKVHVVSMQLHGFSDASKCAYAGVVYLQMVDFEGKVHVSLVTSSCTDQTLDDPQDRILWCSTTGTTTTTYSNSISHLTL